MLEHDIPQLGIRIPAATLRRFWTMLAHYHGQIWNQAELTRSMTVVMTDLSLERLFVVYPGNRSAELEERIGTLPIGDLPGLLL